MKTETTATTVRLSRQEIRAQARTTIRDCVSKPAAIAAGLRIAATRMLGRKSSASGCLRAATDISAQLACKYPDSATLADRLARLVHRRDWESLWTAARREVYPYSCS